MMFHPSNVSWSEIDESRSGGFALDQSQRTMDRQLIENVVALSFCMKPN
jgi:hypothetical protein